jgi:hypothetical protein
MAGVREPDIIALTLVDTLEQLQSTRLVLSSALTVAHDLTVDNRKLRARVDDLIDQLRDAYDAPVRPGEMFRQRGR